MFCHLCSAISLCQYLNKNLHEKQDRLKDCSGADWFSRGKKKSIFDVTCESLTRKVDFGDEPDDKNNESTWKTEGAALRTARQPWLATPRKRLHVFLPHRHNNGGSSHFWRRSEPVVTTFRLLPSRFSSAWLNPIGTIRHSGAGRDRVRVCRRRTWVIWPSHNPDFPCRMLCDQCNLFQLSALLM